MVCRQDNTQLAPSSFDEAELSLVRLKGTLMGLAAFSNASRILSQLNTSSDSDLTFLALQRLECIILDHIPQGPSDTVVMLDLIIQEVTAGGRSDGRDVSALFSIRAMMVGLDKSVSSPSA